MGCWMFKKLGQKHEKNMGDKKKNIPHPLSLVFSKEQIYCPVSLWASDKDLVLLHKPESENRQSVMIFLPLSGNLSGYSGP